MSVTSKYQSNPGKEHWIAVKNILKYLRKTKNLFLIFGGDSKLRVEGVFLFDILERFYIYDQWRLNML